MLNIQHKFMAEALVKAFEYVDNFSGCTIVIKYGGNAMTEEKLKMKVFTDISILSRLGMKVVLVHGGGPYIEEKMKKDNLAGKKINGLRVTDEATLNIVKDVFKKINLDCVNILTSLGINAFDCTKGLITAKLMDDALGYVGIPVNVNTEILISHLEKGNIPVVSSLGDTEWGQTTNINADTAATEIAIALNAEKLTILTNVDGVIINGELITHLSVSQVKNEIKAERITEGMIPKLLACSKAVINKVKKAHLINGKTEHSLLLEIFTEHGIGTEVVYNGNK